MLVLRSIRVFGLMALVMVYGVVAFVLVGI
jgi:hypothetical protein